MAVTQFQEIARQKYSHHPKKAQLHVYLKKDQASGPSYGVWFLPPPWIFQ
jgi:hypothetical protein